MTKKVAYIFPGQGTQVPGMGYDLYQSAKAARTVFETADFALGFKLSELCFHGSEKELTQTENAQPAVLTCSIASLDTVNELNPGILPEPDYVAGHSLGEYTALVCAGVLSLHDGLLLVRKRGELMKEASQSTPGCMMAIIGLEVSVIQVICQDFGVEIANYNSPDQIVLTGLRQNLEKARERCLLAGASRVVPLNVSGAFHSSLMAKTASKFRQILDTFTFNKAVIPVMSNVSGKPIPDFDYAPELESQLVSGVRWQQCVEYMMENGVETFYEIGPGKTLSGLIKRISRDATVLHFTSFLQTKQPS